MSIDLFHFKQFWKKAWIVDFILVALFGISLYATIKTSDPIKGFDYSSFFSNLTTGIVGSWMAVRIIDKLIKKREKLQTARRELLRNLRHPYDYVFSISPYFRQKDVNYLEREMKWFRMRWNKRSGVFFLREQDIARRIEQLNLQLVVDINNYVIGKSIPYNSVEEEEKQMKKRNDVIEKTLDDLIAQIELLVIEVWKRDDPDR